MDITINLETVGILTYGLRLRMEEDARQGNDADIRACLNTARELSVQLENLKDKYDGWSTEAASINAELCYLEALIQEFE